MRNIKVYNSVTLDGVMQSPGGAEEDTRGGFRQGGWAAPYADEVTMAPARGGPGTLLFGRRTYEKMERGWRNGPADNPFTAIMNGAPKYVVSRTRQGPLDWENSVLLSGDAIAAVARLKEEGDEAITILGSGELIRSIAPAGLIDSYVLLIHPLVLGEGLRLFTDGMPPVALDLVEVTPSPSGVIVATYRPR